MFTSNVGRSSAKVFWISCGWLITVFGCQNQSTQESLPPVSQERRPPERKPVEAAAIEAQESAPENNVAPPSESPLSNSDRLKSSAFDPQKTKFSMVAIGTESEGCFGYGVVCQKSSTGFDVLTANHVLDGRKLFTVQAWQGEPGAAKLQTFLSVTTMHRDPDKDLAWVRVRASQADVVAISVAKTAERVGQTGWTYQVRDGQAVFEACEIEQRVRARHRETAAPVSYWRLSKRIESGLSGGGLVNAQGHLIGIASGNGDGQAHYVDEVEIRQFLKQAGLQ